MKIRYVSIAVFGLFSVLNCAVMSQADASGLIAAVEKLDYESSTNSGITNFIKAQKDMCEYNRCKEALNAQQAINAKVGGHIAAFNLGKALYEQRTGKKEEEKPWATAEKFEQLSKKAVDFVNTKGYDEHFKEESKLLFTLRDVCKKKDSEERNADIEVALCKICMFVCNIGFRFPIPIVSVFQYNFMEYVLFLLDFAHIFNIDPINLGNEHIGALVSTLKFHQELCKTNYWGDGYAIFEMSQFFQGGWKSWS